MLISKDSKPNSDVVEKEKLTIMPEKDWQYKTKINSTLWNTDLCQESQTQKSFVKSSMPPSTVTKSFARQIRASWKNTVLKLVWPTTLLHMRQASSVPEDYWKKWVSTPNTKGNQKWMENSTQWENKRMKEKDPSKQFWT